MLKIWAVAKILGGAIALFLVIFSLGGIRQGISDAVNSLTHLQYYEYRDMRKTVAFVPQHRVTRPPDPESVPVTGKDRTYGLEGVDLATKLSDVLVNPIAADDSSVSRGQQKFIKTCVPCHGVSMAGDGPVAALFMPPPDLLAEATRLRHDGYLYSYIRFGGAVMPSYGARSPPRRRGTS